jgi:hypothetical protein
MGQIKVSELIPKDAPLSDTDLIMIAEETSDGYDSKKITGHEIIARAQTGLQRELVSGENIKTLNETSLLGTGNIAVQPTLVSATNIKTINSNSLLGSGDIVISSNPKTLASVNGVAVVGSTNQISASVLIPGGTLKAHNTIYIRDLIVKTAGTVTTSPRLYINTTNSLTGATLIGSSGTMNTTTQYIQQFWRNFYFDGTNLYCYSPATAISSDLTSGVISLIPLNLANDYYLIFAIQNGTATPDSVSHKRVIVQIYD